MACRPSYGYSRSLTKDFFAAFKNKCRNRLHPKFGSSKRISIWVTTWYFWFYKKTSLLFPTMKWAGVFNPGRKTYLLKKWICWDKCISSWLMKVFWMKRKQIQYLGNKLYSWDLPRHHCKTKPHHSLPQNKRGDLGISSYFTTSIKQPMTNFDLQRFSSINANSDCWTHDHVGIILSLVSCPEIKLLEEEQVSAFRCSMR